MTLYGRTIDAYHIGRLLGRGSFGDVYEAKCQHSGQLVTIKMISKELLHNQGLLDRITREVEIHCQLQHPHIVELYEYFEDDRRVYLVMELCKNGELLALLHKHGRFDAATARSFFSQLVDGVAYLHGHSILHRDLKLSNLLLSADNTLKIADFGLAAAIGANDPERRTICGTPNYMCPEIVEQQPYSLGADLWSLGVTLYTLLTGTPPFQSDAVRGTLQRVGCADYLLPRQLPAEAADLISQLLQKNPAQRLSLPAIQSHPFLVGPSTRQATPPESESDRASQATRSGTASPRTNFAPESLHTVEQRERAERLYEGDRVEERGSGRGNRKDRSEGGLNQSEMSGAVERSGKWDGQRALRNEVPAQSHPREHRSEGQRETQRGLSESSASAGRMEVTGFSDPGFGRTEGVWVDHGMASSGLRERTPEGERLWSRASGPPRNEASAGTAPRTDVRTERRTDRRTEQNASESRGSDARPQGSSSRPGTASSDPGGLRASSAVPSRSPPGATQLPTRPLSTLRLKALRHETSYGSLAILEDGRVQVHNTGPGGSVLTVSTDGLEVEVEQAGRPGKTYRFPALPDALLMHYAHAAAFVGLVASATPKVIYIFERGQATCMENGDLQVCFTDCSPTALLQVDAASGKITVTPPNGAPVTLPSLHSRPTDFQASPSHTWQPSPDDTWLWEVLSQARRCQRKCAEAEARALARQPPKTFPLVARSARLKTVSPRGGADATVALAAAAPPAEVERAAELVAAVQGLHTSLLPANVSVASAQELSFASSSEASSHLQPGPRFPSQSQHAPAPILKRALPHSPSSPLSPSPSLPETPSTRDGSSLERVAERQPFHPFAARGRPTPFGHVAELDDRERRPSGLRHASSEERPAPEDRRDVLGTEAVERRQEGLERSLDDVRRHVAVEQRVGRILPTGEASARRSAGVEEAFAPEGAERPPRPKRNGSEELRNAAGPIERGAERAARSAAGTAAGDVGRQQRDQPARVLADVSNRPPADAQTARRVEKAKGDQRGSGVLDGVRRRADRFGSAGPIGGSLKSSESERRRLPVIGEGFKVFEDRGEVRPRSRLPEAKVQHSATVRHMHSQEGSAGESEAEKLSGSYKDPDLDRRTDHSGGQRLGQSQAPLDPPSARSFSDTWQDLSAANREPSDFHSADPPSDSWQHLSGARRTLPAASPSSDTWHDGRSEDPVFEGLSVPVELRKAERSPAREDARSYVASNRLVTANQGSSVTANRGSSSALPGPSASHSSPPSLPESPLPLSQNTRDFLSPPSASDTARQGDPPQLDGAAGRPRKDPNGANDRQSTWSRRPGLDTAKTGDPPEPDGGGNVGRERFSGRPGKGPHSANGRQSAYFPGVGWAIRLKSGELLMHYLDDCQMVVSNDGASVEFWPPGAKMGGSKYTLSDRASIPQEVRDKLQYLSAFIKLIRKQSHGTQTYSKWVTPRTSPALTAQ